MRMRRLLAEQGSAQESDQSLFGPSLISRMSSSTGRDTNEMHEMSFECHVADIFFEKNNHLRQKHKLQKTIILSRNITIKDFNKTLDASSSAKFECIVCPTDTTLD